MSRGRYLMLWTILVHLAGLALSYLYGETIPAWIERKLPGRAGFVHHIAFWLYSRPITLLPRSVQPAFLHHPGLAWLSFAVFLQLCYLLRYLRHRAEKRDLGAPYSGNPGGQYWEHVQRRFKDYQEAALRWKHGFKLKTPAWYYYKRQESSQPDLFWRGRRLIIEKELLRADRVQELAPMLARELMYYNCDDALFRDILACYPDRFTRWQLLLHVLGLCIFLPVMFMRRFFWHDYWAKRVLVADKFAYCLGQGHVLFSHIQSALEQEEQVKQERREVTRKIQDLEERVKAHAGNLRFGAYSYSHSDSSDPNPGQLNQRVAELRQREQQLLELEQQALEVHPLVEERREQLAALLRTEWAWMEQRGIVPSVQVTSLPPAQDPR
jgi:hypothetical protein